MLTYIADFALGLFVGVYALASFSPTKEIAEKVYRLCWFFGGGFVVLAYLQSTMAGPSARGLFRSQQNETILFGLSGLELTVITGIALAFVAGKFIIKQKLADA